ncbi:hypothetical protein ACHRVW_14210 [Flavobacterium collinsii]|uniref:hypothetical protein n=1 Tax=Flavobacterium collinsii TaxID=1114861 RepID=UPI0037572B93
MKKLLLMPVFFTLVLFYSCNHDENVHTEKVSENKNEDNLKSVPVTESVAFLKDFQQQQSTQKNANFNLTIDFKSIEQIDITDTDAKLTVVKAETGLDNVDSSILQIRINGELQTVLFNLIPEEGFSNKKTGKVIERYGEFTGAVVISDLRGIVKNNFLYKSGYLVGEIKAAGPDPIPLNNVNVYPKPKSSDISLPYIMPGYQFRGEGSPTNYTSMGVAFASYYSNIIYQAMEKRIIDKDLTPCQKAVLEKLKETKNFDIANMLKKLGATTPYTLNIVGGNLNIPAQTTRTKNSAGNIPNDYTTTISNSYTTRTSLSLAGNMLHEIVHAYFLSLYDASSAGSGMTAFVDNPTLFQSYVQKNFPNNGIYVGGVYVDQQDLHHKQMAETYVNAIASTLQEFQTGTVPPVNVPLNQEYLDLAWGGLKGTPVFDKTFPEGSVDRSRILNRLACEQSGSDVQSNGGTRQYPLGAKCEDFKKK